LGMRPSSFFASLLVTRRLLLDLGLLLSIFAR